MPYSEIQFVGYALDTGPRPQADVWLGLANPRDDIAARCSLLKRALETARDHLPPAAPSAAGTVLKLFLAPEFLFRGAAGAYSAADVETILAALQALVADSQWTDWLLAFGTIAAVIGPGEAPAGRSYMPILAGGPGGGWSDDVKAVAEALAAGIEDIAGDIGAGGVLLGQLWRTPSGPLAGPEKGQQKILCDGGGIFPLLGVTWAAEVCRGDLQGDVISAPALPGEQQVQVQLVPSAGASPAATPMIAGPDGWIFGVGGSGGALATLAAAGGAAVAPLATVSVPDDDIHLRGGATVGVAGGVTVGVADLYPAGAGTITVFPVQAMPAPTVVPGVVAPLTVWEAEPYRFAFELVYSEDGFITALCCIESQTVDFRGNRYVLPLSLRTTDRDGAPVCLRMRLEPASGRHDRSVWCRFETREMKFEGVAFQFASAVGGPAPETVW